MSSSAETEGRAGYDPARAHLSQPIDLTRQTVDAASPQRPATLPEQNPDTDVAALQWRIVSPAPRVAALASGERVARLTLAQVRNADSAAVYRDAEPMAVVMFARHGWRRVEMALAVSPAAAPHMKRLVRMAQLTLARMAEDRIVVAWVDPANTAGQRMAALTGFRRSRLKSPALWVFRR